ncbi:head-tail adaptor protein [Labilibacter sediminis]|nr:head-tail adaptor protein [Labilibacter sediminis]
MLTSVLKHRISVIKKELTTDEYNSEVENDVVIYPILKAGIKYDSFSQYDVGDLKRLTNVQRVTFKIRYKPNIDDNCKILFNGSYYEVYGVEIVGRNKELKILTTKL